jgi:hypothetical protein
MFSQVIVPVHVNGNHWMLFVSDILLGTWQLGNSMNGDPSPDNVCCFRNLVNQAGKDGEPLQKGPRLLIARQTDSYSCAIAVLDLICELTVSTSPWTPTKMHLWRMEYALLLCLGTGTLSEDQLGLAKGALLTMKMGSGAERNTAHKARKQAVQRAGTVQCPANDGNTERRADAGVAHAKGMGPHAVEETTASSHELEPNSQTMLDTPALPGELASGVAAQFHVPEDACVARSLVPRELEKHEVDAV